MACHTQDIILVTFQMLVGRYFACSRQFDTAMMHQRVTVASHTHTQSAGSAHAAYITSFLGIAETHATHSNHSKTIVYWDAEYIRLIVVVHPKRHFSIPAARNDVIVGSNVHVTHNRHVAPTEAYQLTEALPCAEIPYLKVFVSSVWPIKIRNLKTK